MIGGVQFRPAQVDNPLLDLPRELEQHVIEIVHRRAGVLADVKGLICRAIFHPWCGVEAPLPPTLEVVIPAAIPCLTALYLLRFPLIR